MNKIISDTLKDLGITPGVHGYYYLRCAVTLTIEDMTLVHRITKELYPRVAKQFGTTTSRVERAIRHAITLAWDGPDSDARAVIFRCSVRSAMGKPTNGQFIATVADYLITAGRVSNVEAC